VKAGGQAVSGATQAVNNATQTVGGDASNLIGGGGLPGSGH
jgi:hypothetical protein